MSKLSIFPEKHFEWWSVKLEKEWICSPVRALHIAKSKHNQFDTSKITLIELTAVWCCRIPQISISCTIITKYTLNVTVLDKYPSEKCSELIHYLCPTSVLSYQSHWDNAWLATEGTWQWGFPQQFVDPSCDGIQVLKALIYSQAKNTQSQLVVAVNHSGSYSSHSLCTHGLRHN